MHSHPAGVSSPPTCVAEHVLHHRVVHGGQRLVDGLRNGHPLAGGQPAGLHHDGCAQAPDVRLGGLRVGEGFVLCGGDAVLPACIGCQFRVGACSKLCRVSGAPRRRTYALADSGPVEITHAAVEMWYFLRAADAEPSAHHAQGVAMWQMFR